MTKRADTEILKDGAMYELRRYALARAIFIRRVERLPLQDDPVTSDILEFNANYAFNCAEVFLNNVELNSRMDRLRKFDGQEKCVFCSKPQRRPTKRKAR